MTSTLDETLVTTNKFLIEANPRYELIAPDNITLVRNTAEDVNYYHEAATAISKTNLTYKIGLGENNFLNRGVTIKIDSVPLVITRKVAPTGSALITEDNYVNDFFENYQHLAYKQFGIMNAIDSIQVKFGSVTHTINNVAEMLKVMANYYDESIVYDKVDASLPDMFSSYDHYDNGANKTITTLVDAVDTKKFQMSVPPMNQNNIFSNYFNSDYNSRTPNLVFTSATADRKSVTCQTTPLSFFLPLTVFGIEGLDDTPLYGISTVQISITLKSNIAHWLFCRKGNVYDDIKFNDSGLESFTSHIQYSIYTPPFYIGDKLRESIPEYKVNLPIAEVDATVQDMTAEAFATFKIPVKEYDIRAIPKHVYIYAQRKRDESNNMDITDTYAVPRSLTVEIAGKKTVISSDTEGLFKLCKGQGLNTSITQAKFLSGFPIKLDVSDHLGLPTNTVVGSINGIRNRLKISGTFANLSDSKVTYEIKCLIIYQGMLHYKDKKFTIYESLLSSAAISSDMHASALYDGTSPSINYLGGSWMSAIGSFAKKGATGMYNLAKNMISNKDGFRDEVIKKWNGGANNFNQIGGARTDNHTPFLGGRAISSFEVQHK